MVNTSLLQTMTRSVYTLATVLIICSRCSSIGGDTLKNFAFALLVGVTSGAYSSIFIASPLLVLWKNWDNRKRAAVRAAAGVRETLATSTPGAATASNAYQMRRPAPKRKAPAPPPRYRKKREGQAQPMESPSTSEPGGIIGLLAELQDEHGGDSSDEQLPRDP